MIPRRQRMARVLASGIVVLAAATVAPGAASAQSIPHLTGRTEVGLRAGTVSGDVCLANLNPRGDSVTIALNNAYKITGVTGAFSDPVSREVEPGGTGVRYTFAGVPDASPDGASAESHSGTAICLQYSGRFPVHDIASGDYREDDASSVVAFTGSVVRARGISRWHPTPYDPTTGLAAEAVTWQLEVECDDCARVYVNGEVAEAGEGPVFESSEPRELLLVAGDLSVTRAGGVTFVGSPVAADSAEAFAGILHQVGGFLESYTGVPFGSPPDVIGVASAQAPRRGSLWGFLGDPALALIGMSIPELLTAVERPGSSSRMQVLGFLSHELAHRYFAWRMGAGTAQRDFFGEPFAVYLELKAIRHFFGEAEYRRGVARLSEQAARLDDPTSLRFADADDFAESAYRYGYAPLMLFSLESAIGEPAMRELLRAMLESPAAERHVADYGFMARSAIRSGVPAEVWSAWETRCLTPASFEGDCLPGMDGSREPVGSRAESGAGQRVRSGSAYASTSSAPGG